MDWTLKGKGLREKKGSSLCFPSVIGAVMMVLVCTEQLERLHFSHLNSSRCSTCISVVLALTGNYSKDYFKWRLLGLRRSRNAVNKHPALGDCDV